MFIAPRQLHEAQEGKCFHCGKGMSSFPALPGKKKDKGWTREHLVPKAYIKGHKLCRPKYNIVLAHAKCNRDRRHTFPTKAMVSKFVEIHKKILNF